MLFYIKENDAILEVLIDDGFVYLNNGNEFIKCDSRYNSSKLFLQIANDANIGNLVLLDVEDIEFDKF